MTCFCVIFLTTKKTQTKTTTTTTRTSGFSDTRIEHATHVLLRARAATAHNVSDR